MWEISRLARFSSIYQRFFEHYEDTRTTVAITDGWMDEVQPDGTVRLIADISAAIAQEEPAAASPSVFKPVSIVHSVKASDLEPFRRISGETTTVIFR